MHFLNFSFDTLNSSKRSIIISKSTTVRFLDLNPCIAKLIEGLLITIDRVETWSIK